MTEQEAKAFPIGATVRYGAGRPQDVETVVGHSQYNRDPTGWEVLTVDTFGRTNCWVCATSLTLIRPAPAPAPSYGLAPVKAEGAPQYDISTDTMKPTEPQRPLCPVEAEPAGGIDWDAHRRFMRGLG